VTAGEAPWTPVLDVNTGTAGLFAPMDVGFPADGVRVDSGDTDVCAIADLDLEALESARAGAQVDSDRDWSAQLRPALARVVLSPLD